MGAVPVTTVLSQDGGAAASILKGEAHGPPDAPASNRSLVRNHLLRRNVCSDPPAAWN